MLARFRMRDVVAALVISGLAAAALVPALATSREAARRRQCVDNLRVIGVALRQYHEAQGALPPAAVWERGALRTNFLYELKRFDQTVHENWAQLLLPYLGRDDVAAQFDRRQPVMVQANKLARESRVAEFMCAADGFNGSDNLYGFQPWDDRPPLAEFARGNYAINGGSHSIKYAPQTSAQPRGESMHIEIDSGRGRFEAVGSGVAGINHSFRLADFANGQSTLVAVDELRAGVHPLDMRGVWALGHIGSSITWAHGAVGDACGPNNAWDRSDDIFDCGRIHKAVGSDALERLRMPCCWYIDLSQEATARSQHPGGVSLLFLDGAARFVRDEVDRGLWHVMHSRETPSDAFDELEWELARSDPAPEAPAQDPSIHINAPVPGETMTNSLGMAFAVLPAGTFTMGVPDVGNDGATPECPPHEVTLSGAFWLGVHEVTQGQYQSVIGNNPSQRAPEMVGAEAADFPVESVTWHEAVEFCKRLGDLPEERSAKRRYRLPTEAEWEYACRSGKSEPYHWTPRREAIDKSGDAAGIEPPLPVTKVGAYPPNEFGLFDMRGNVWEWCADWFDRAYYSRSPKCDPRGPASGYLKVVRGGDWVFVGETCAINYPIMSPSKRSPFVGFRIICELGR